MNYVPITYNGWRGRYLINYVYNNEIIDVISNNVCKFV